MNLKTKLEEMRKRCEAATPGGWRLSKWPEMKSLQVVGRFDELIGEFRYHYKILDPNAEFIAASRTDMPALIDALEVCLQALEYINTHELYHGVNQGMPSEQTSKEALLRVEDILGNVSAALASQGEEE